MVNAHAKSERKVREEVFKGHSHRKLNAYPFFITTIHKIRKREGVCALMPSPPLSMRATTFSLRQNLPKLCQLLMLATTKSYISYMFTN